MYNKVNKLASAVYNNVNSGLQGFTTNDSMSIELVEDQVVWERLQILKEQSLKGTLPYNDLYLSINCIPIDCKDLERCRCGMNLEDVTPTAHFEIPQLLGDIKAIDYIGSSDRQNRFTVYTSSSAIKNSKYRKRGKNKPYVWIDMVPNEHGMYDCFVFNAPFMKSISVCAIFKDLRQLENFNCCESDDNFSFIDNEIVRRLSEKMLRYYRLGIDPPRPNNQQYNPG